MNLYLNDKQRQQIARHGEWTYPREGCGMLIGHHNDNGVHIVDVMTVDNARKDSQHNRYVIAPEDGRVLPFASGRAGRAVRLRS